MKDRSRDLIFLSVVVLVHLVFYLLAFHFKKIYNGDSFEYVQEALNIKEHFFFYCGNLALPVKCEYMTLRPPLYPLFLMAIYFFAVNSWLVLAIQNVLSVITIYYARDTMLKLGYKRTYDWLLLILIVAYPSQFFFANNICADTFLQCFVVWYFRQLVLFWEKKKWKYAFGASAAVFLGAMAKPIFFPFALINLVFMVLIARSYSLSIYRTILIALLPVCGILAYCGWNQSRTGKFHFSSIEEINTAVNYQMFMASREGTLSAMDAHDSLLARAAVLPSFKDRYALVSDCSRQYIKSHLASYIRFHLMHSVRFFIEPGKAEIDLFTGWLSYTFLGTREAVNKGFYATIDEKGWAGLKEYVARNPSIPIVLIILIGNIVKIMGLFLYCVNRSMPRMPRLFIMVIIGYFALAVGPVANTHYVLPVSLIMMCCGAVGIIEFINKRRNLIS